MEEDLLCTFHYFGITDLKTISDAGKSSAEKMENFRYLTSDERVEHVMKRQRTTENGGPPAGPWHFSLIWHLESC